MQDVSLGEKPKRASASPPEVQRASFILFLPSGGPITRPVDIQPCKFYRAIRIGILEMALLLSETPNFEAPVPETVMIFLQV